MVPDRPSSSPAAARAAPSASTSSAPDSTLAKRAWAMPPSPGLSDHRGGHHGSLPGAMDVGEQRPGVAIAAVESDERSCIEHPHPEGGSRRRTVGCQAVRARAAAMSSPVMGPASASYSAMTAAKRSRPRRSAVAWAIQELTPPRPARARTSFARSLGSVTVNLGISRSLVGGQRPAVARSSSPRCTTRTTSYRRAPSSSRVSSPVNSRKSTRLWPARRRR